MKLTDTAHACGVKVLFDAVLNHKAAADFSEIVRAVRVDPRDRGRVVGEGEVEEGSWCVPRP